MNEKEKGGFWTPVGYDMNKTFTVSVLIAGVVTIICVLIISLCDISAKKTVAAFEYGYEQVERHGANGLYWVKCDSSKISF